MRNEDERIIKNRRLNILSQKAQRYSPEHVFHHTIEKNGQLQTACGLFAELSNKTRRPLIEAPLNEMCGNQACIARWAWLKEEWRSVGELEESFIRTNASLKRIEEEKRLKVIDS